VVVKCAVSVLFSVLYQCYLVQHLELIVPRLCLHIVRVSTDLESQEVGELKKSGNVIELVPASLDYRTKIKKNCMLQEWPLNLFDLNPVSYIVWQILRKQVYQACFAELDHLKHRLRT